MDLAELTRDDFEKCLHQTFRIEIEGREPLETELIEVRGMAPPDHDPERREPFSCIFQGPKDTPLAQGIFRLDNPTLGELGLFLVSLGPDKDGTRYEAVFT